MAILPSKVVFRGITLDGCVGFDIRRKVTSDKISVGALGDVARSKNTNLSGTVTFRFELQSQGQKELVQIYRADDSASGDLEVERDSSTFTTGAGLNPDRSDPSKGLWSFDAATLPDR